MRTMVVVSLLLGCLFSSITSHAISFTLTHEYADPNAAPENDFNEVIWKAVRGADSEMPAPVRAAFVRTYRENDD